MISFDRSIRIHRDAVSAAVGELEEEYSSRLVVNPDLDRASVSFQASKNRACYRWFKYKEAFSQRLVAYILRSLKIGEGAVLDPFAGSGTTLFSASEAGIDSLGIELLPSGAEVIRIRNLVANTDREGLSDAIERFRKAKEWEKDGPVRSVPSIRITAGAYPDHTERMIGRYLAEVECVDDPIVRRLLRFAALCVLEDVSYTRKDGQYLRWDSRAPTRSTRGFFSKGTIAEFSAAVDRKLFDIEVDLNVYQYSFEADTPQKNTGQVTLISGSCLEILPRIDAYFDAIITSPPYCNRYDYTRTYALELAFLGLDDHDVRELRQRMLSSTVENREKLGLDREFGREVADRARKAFRNQRVLQEVLLFLSKCKEANITNNPSIPRMVKNYFWEMCLTIFECARRLKPSAPFVMVNDNVRYEGANIPVDLILSEFAKSAGLEVETIWVLPRGKGNSSQQMGNYGRSELRKCVYVWRARA